MTLLAASVAACSGDVEESGDPDEVADFDDAVPAAWETESEVPLLGRIEGEFDGETLRFWNPEDPTVIEEVGQEFDPEGAEGEVGTVRQSALVLIPSAQIGTGGTGVGTNKVVAEQISAHVRRNGTGTWAGSTCGTAPANGTCAQIRLRNLYGTQDVIHAYVKLTSLTATGDCTVQTPAPAATNQTSPQDWSVGAPGHSNGLWRYGQVGFLSPALNGPDRWWIFRAPPSPPCTTFTFTFKADAYGQLQRPTVRATVASGTVDAPPYTVDGSPGSVAATGSQMSGNGQYAVFASGATNQHPEQTIAGFTNVFRKDPSTGELLIASRNTAGAVPSTPISCDANSPSVSSDGRYVAFESDCDMGFTTPQRKQIYLRDLVAGVTTLVSRDVADASAGADGAAALPALSADGAYVAFQSTATNLVTAGARPAGRTVTDVYRYEVASGAIIRVNVPPGLSATDPSVTWPGRAQTRAAISGDGALVAFESDSRNIVGPDSWNNVEVFLYDVASSLGTGVAVMSRMSSPSTGGELAQLSSCVRPALSTDGSTIGMLCTRGQVSDPAIAASPTATVGRRHLYIRDTIPGNNSSIRMIDLTPAGTAEANASVDLVAPSFSPGGRFVAYASTGTNLLNTTGCTPACITVPAGVSQVYVHDRFAVQGTGQPRLRRSWLASMIRPATAVTPNYAVLPSGVIAGRISLGGAEDNLFASYTATSSGADWQQLPSQSDQVFVSPVGDPLFQ